MEEAAEKASREVSELRSPVTSPHLARAPPVTSDRFPPSVAFLPPPAPPSLAPPLRGVQAQRLQERLQAAESLREKERAAHREAIEKEREHAATGGKQKARPRRLRSRRAVVL